MKTFTILFVKGLVLLLFLPEVLSAQTLKPWLVRVEVGRAEIHRSESTGWVAGLRLGRDLGAKRNLRVEGGIVASAADEDFIALDTSLELRPVPKAAVSPFVGAAAGLMVEPEYGGTVFRAGAGFDLNFTARNCLRLSLYRGTHGGAGGPHLITVGLGLRF